MHNSYLDINYPQWSNFTTAGFWSLSSKKTASRFTDRSTGRTGGQELIADATRAVDLTDEGATQRQLVDFAVKVVFLVGQTVCNETQTQIEAESEQYGDVIQESFLDSYNNLTLKTIMMLKWVTTNCGDRGTLYVILCCSFLGHSSWSAHIVQNMMCLYEAL